MLLRIRSCGLEPISILWILKAILQDRVLCSRENVKSFPILLLFVDYPVSAEQISTNLNLSRKIEYPPLISTEAVWSNPCFAKLFSRKLPS